jgi:hypothetical protein
MAFENLMKFFYHPASHRRTTFEHPDFHLFIPIWQLRGGVGPPPGFLN